MGRNDISILLMSPLPPPVGGIATWTKGYLEWCNVNGLAIDIIDIAVIGKKGKQTDKKRNVMDEFLRTIRIIKKLNKILTKQHFDVVHLNCSCGVYGIIRDYLCAKIIKKRGLTLVVHYHCNLEDQVKKGSPQIFFLKMLTQKSDVNLVLNNSSLLYLEKETGIKGNIVSNFIDERFIIDKKKNFNSAIERISYVGSVQEAKGLKEIIEVARFFPKIQFILVGPALCNPKVLDAAPRNVVFKGATNKEEIIDILKVSDVFLFPTYSEGFSIALLEAMGMGLPIITTGVGANRDMIESHGGILVRTRCTIDIIEAIKHLEDLEIRKKMSLWNIMKVKKNYTLNEVMKSFLEVYNNLI